MDEDESDSATGVISNKEKKANKRKSEESPPKGDDNTTIVETREASDSITKISAVINELVNKITSHPTVRNDIKLMAEELKELDTSLLNGVILSTLNTLKPNVNKRTKIIDVVKEALPKEQNKEQSRKYYCEKCKIEMENEEEDKRIIQEGVNEALQLEKEQYSLLVKRKWPKCVYKKTKLLVGDPLRTKTEDLLIFVDHKKENTSLMTVIKNRYPEFEDLLVDDLEENTVEEKITKFENITTTKMGTQKRRIYLTDTKDENMLKDVILKIKDNLEENQRNKIAAAASTPELRILVRKTLEIVFKNIHMDIEFYQPREATKEISKYRRENREEAIVIQTDPSTYAETLRNIRLMVDPEQMGIEVKAIKTTKDKRVVIVTEEGKAGELHKEITAKVSGIQTKISGRGHRVQLHVLDIDASMSGKEVEECIRKETKEFETQVKNIRLARSGTQIATVAMPTQAAESLIRSGDIKVGWTRCRVKPKVEMMRCYNCLKIGHHSDICRENKEKRCLNCSKPGHISKECSENSYCTTCENEGHRTDSTYCPTYRRKEQEMYKKLIGAENQEDYQMELDNISTQDKQAGVSQQTQK